MWMHRHPSRVTVYSRYARRPAIASWWGERVDRSQQLVASDDNVDATTCTDNTKPGDFDLLMIIVRITHVSALFSMLPWMTK